MFITVKSYQLLQLPIFQQLTSTRKDIFDITIFFLCSIQLKLQNSSVRRPKTNQKGLMAILYCRILQLNLDCLCKLLLTF